MQNILDCEIKGTETPFHGNGKLTDKIINSLQNLLPLGNQLYKVKKAVGAILWHFSGTDLGDECRHQYCPSGEFSCCKFKKDKDTMKDTYNKKINLPKWMFQILQAVFVDLSKDKLLSWFLHGQNANVASNSIAWTKCPKTVFVNRKSLELGINSAVLQFNIGASGINKVFTK